MNELRPILDSDPTEEDRRLLGSIRLDIPPPGGKTRVLLTLGLGTEVAVASTGTAVLSTAKQAGIGLVWKWLAAGAVAGATMTTTIEVVRQVSSTTSTEQRREAPVPAAPRDVATRAEPPRARPAPPETDELDDRAGSESAAVRGAAHVGAASQPASTTPAAGVSSLTEEVGLLDRARRSLTSGDASGAVRILDEYARRFPSPRLGPEAALVRVEALLALGRKLDARRLAESMLASQPDSAHAKRLRTLLQVAGDGTP
jgi:hypothetical protein